ncbi:MAG: hypothetical protein KF753_21395 [Caldilineaceae bacterium]|nr:hypothetical protein [Caldilineaceae bacterium]
MAWKQGHGNSGVFPIISQSYDPKPDEERGVFRSTDRGKSWEKILCVSEKAGALDLRIAPRNPDILYTSFWGVHRNFWALVESQNDPGLYRPDDFGGSWQLVSDNPGPRSGQMLSGPFS